jgi:histone acetyltransferase (RNA polymerase elongator complex component)
MKNKILPVFITFAGCTSRCVYCNQHRITGIKPSNVLISAKDQIDECMSMGVEWTELAFYGGSFSCLPDEIRKSLYALAHETGISTLRFSTSPDCINEDIIRESIENNVKTIELGVQSFDDDVLKANKRPYDSSQCLRAIALIKASGISLGIQLMAGMYIETDETFVSTIDTAVSANADYARIYPTVVIEETELADMYGRGMYDPLTLADAVAKCAYGYIMLTASGCDVIRMGLHDSPSVKESALAGAYHPAMGDMAKTVVMQTFFEAGFKIEVAQQYLNTAYGYKAYLKNMHRDKVSIKEGVEPDFVYVTKKILERSGENNKRKLQEQITGYAERLISQTHNG